MPHVPQHALTHDPRSQQAGAIPSHDAHAHLRHRAASYTAPNVALVGANPSNSLRTNLITVPIQDNAIQPQMHESIPVTSYYNQYQGAYPPTIAHAPHTIPSAPQTIPPIQPIAHLNPIHNVNMTIPPPHLGTQPAGNTYYAQQAVYTQGQTYSGKLFQNRECIFNRTFGYLLAIYSTECSVILNEYMTLAVICNQNVTMSH